MSILAKNPVLQTILEEHIESLAEQEHLEPELIREGVDQGLIALLANPAHPNVAPILVGQPTSIKVNANIGTSPMVNDVEREYRKLKAAEIAGAHTLMDLSTAGDLDDIRVNMLEKSPLPLGTVPIYGIAQKFVAEDKDPALFEPEDLFQEIIRQAEQGVDFMTLHVGVTRRAAEIAAKPESEGGRVLGIVSRGGSIMARWMRRTGLENPLLTDYDRLLDICLKHNVTISLGDGLRPGAGADAGDVPQMEEVGVLAECTLRAWEKGVQIMIEGPGHVPLNLVEAQIRSIKRMCHNAPLYVLGPLTTDSSPGYDHISGAIGGALAAMAGADFLCYVTPAEHLTLPDAADVHAGVMASRIAAQSAEVAMGRPQAVGRDLTISRARKELDWQLMAETALDPKMVKERRAAQEHERECAMCGKFCAVRMLDETVG